MPHHIRTPLVPSRVLSERLGADVRVKLESAQPTGSFKIRGIGHFVERARDRGVQRIVASSGGNAGLAAAYACRIIGMPCVVVVPENADPLFRERIRKEGAEVLVHGPILDDARVRALELAAEAGSVYLSPYDHPDLWDGHASLTREVLEEGFEPDTVVLAVGGGGLMAGVLLGFERAGLPAVRCAACETEGAASLRAALQAGRVVEIAEIKTIATTLGLKAVSAGALEIAARFDVRSVVVSDTQAVRAALAFADDHRTLVEPACGAALAPVYEAHPALADAKRVLVVACGGAGVSLLRMKQWAERFQ